MMTGTDRDDAPCHGRALPGPRQRPAAPGAAHAARCRPRARPLERAARIAPGGPPELFDFGEDEVRIVEKGRAFARLRFCEALIPRPFDFFAFDFFIRSAYAGVLRGRARFHFGRSGTPAAFRLTFKFGTFRFGAFGEVDFCRCFFYEL